MTGVAIQNNTINGGSWGLEVCLEASKLNPLKILNQHSFSFFFHFSDQWYLLYASKEISTTEIVICSLLSHHILTPNELIFDTCGDKTACCLLKSRPTFYLLT